MPAIMQDEPNPLVPPVTDAGQLAGLPYAAPIVAFETPF